MTGHGVRRPVVAVLVVMAGISLASCVSTNEYGGSNNPTPTSVAPRTEVGVIGTDVTVGGVKAAVLDITAFDQSPHNVPRIAAVVRAENLSSSVQANPDVELLCNETTNTGDWFLGSTWEPNVTLPVNAVTEGQVIIGFPQKGANPEYSGVTCTAPKLRLTFAATATDDARTVVYDVDDSVIADAVRRPRGPNLPLPLSNS